MALRKVLRAFQGEVAYQKESRAVEHSEGERGYSGVNWIMRQAEQRQQEELTQQLAGLEEERHMVTSCLGKEVDPANPEVGDRNLVLQVEVAYAYAY